MAINAQSITNMGPMQLNTVKPQTFAYVQRNNDPSQQTELVYQHNGNNNQICQNNQGFNGMTMSDRQLSSSSTATTAYHQQIGQCNNNNSNQNQLNSFDVHQQNNGNNIFSVQHQMKNNNQNNMNNNHLQQTNIINIVNPFGSDHTNGNNHRQQNGVSSIGLAYNNNNSLNTVEQRYILQLQNTLLFFFLC